MRVLAKNYAIFERDKRKKTAPKRIHNSMLPAGSPMYFYCLSCNHLCDVLPESYTCRPKNYCEECQPLVDKGWIR